MDMSRILIFIVVFGALATFGNIYLSPFGLSTTNNTATGTFTNSSGGIQATAIQNLISTNQTGASSTGGAFGSIFFWFDKVIAFIDFIIQSIVTIPNIFDTIGIPDTPLTTFGGSVITPLGIVKGVIGVGFVVILLQYGIYLISGRK